MHVIAAKAVAFGEALRPSFKAYAKSVAENAKALAEVLKSKGLDIVSGGTDTHLMLVDLRPKRLTGKVAEVALGRAHITCNKNGIPFDPEKPMITSGLRLGTPAGTTRGFGVAEFRHIADLIVEVLHVLSQKGVEEEGMAKAKTDQTLALRIPRNYHHNQYRYFQVVENLQDDALEEGARRLLGDGRERPAHGHAGADEGRQLAGEHDHVDARDVVEGGKVVGHRLARRGAAQADDLQALQPERLLRGRAAGRVDHALPADARLAVGPVGVARHRGPR